MGPIVLIFSHRQRARLLADRALRVNWGAGGVEARSCGCKSIADGALPPRAPNCAALHCAVLLPVAVYFC